MNRLEADVFPPVGHLFIETAQPGQIRNIPVMDEDRGATCLLKSNRPDIPLASYEDSVVEAAIDQRRLLFESKSDGLYEIEIFDGVMLEEGWPQRGVATAIFWSMERRVNLCVCNSTLEAGRSILSRERT